MMHQFASGIVPSAVRLPGGTGGKRALAWFVGAALG
jgi:hypothetical protein